MLLKWLVIGSVIYVLYKYFFGANALNEGEDDSPHIINKTSQKDKVVDEDDYIDYEEVE